MASASAIAARRSSIRQRGGDGMPAAMSSRMRSGSSVRGLSLVSTTSSAPAAAMRAHLRPLAAVAVAAAAEDHDQAPGVNGRTACSARSSASGVCA